MHARKRTGRFISDGWKILDAYTPTVLRADSHIGDHDCLHYCVPGPADHWVTLLYNMLLAEREAQEERKIRTSKISQKEQETIPNKAVGEIVPQENSERTHEPKKRIP